MDTEDIRKIASLKEEYTTKEIIKICDKIDEFHAKKEKFDDEWKDYDQAINNSFNEY